MDKSKIDRSMYQKAKVEASEKEHIAAPASTMLADAWIRLKKNKAAVVALFILIGIILLAIFAPIFSKYSFRDTDYNNVYGLPSAAHIFGADQFGRDLWVRTWMGTRISLMIALVAAILDLVVGVLYGAVSALFGGKVDAVMQRIIEVLVGIPSLIIVILFSDGIPGWCRNYYRCTFHYRMGKHGQTGSCRDPETEESGIRTCFAGSWNQQI